MPKRYVYGSTLRVNTDKPMPRVNEKRRAKRIAEGKVYGSHHDFMATLPCALAVHTRGHVCGFTKEQPRVCGHHLKTVATGGEDRNNQTPVCAWAHREFHDAGSVSVMCDRYGIDWRSLACEYTDLFHRTAG